MSAACSPTPGCTCSTWSLTTCSRCYPSSGGLGFDGVNVDALSWTADGRYLAFVGPGSAQGVVRLLDVTKPGSNLTANSRPVVGSLPGSGPYWRGAVVTPDGRTVIVVEEIADTGQRVRQRLVTFSAATGQATRTLNDLSVVWGYEQVSGRTPTGACWWSATSAAATAWGSCATAGTPRSPGPRTSPPPPGDEAGTQFVRYHGCAPDTVGR